MVAASELPIQENASALDMANLIFGSGATVVSADYDGWSQSSGIYTNGDTVAPDLTPGDTGVILSTGRARDVTNSSGNGNGNGNNGNGNGNQGGAEANQSTNTSTNTPGVNNDADFNALAGTNTYDASILEVDFIPDGDTLSIQFVYSSEEYPEFVNSIYNDLVGVWVNGAPVSLAVGDGDSSITNISDVNNFNLYNDNTNDAFNTEMDGFTATLTLTLNVNPGVVNSIKIGIADVSDSAYDSNLLIAAGSIQSDVLAVDDQIRLDPNESGTLDVLANDQDSDGGTLTITHINGQEVTAGSVVNLATGEQITVNADGTFTVLNDADTETVSFSYTVENDDGISDTAFVFINPIPCFVAGTMLETPDGPCAIEMLEPGDLVLTKDHGPQPLRWIGARSVPATGDQTPIRIEGGAFGDHDTVSLSPQHRVLIRDERAEMLFGQQEVLVAAKDLINDHTVRRDKSRQTVTYVHILFDDHQVVFSEGLATESFLPGPQTLNSFDADVVNEICTLFPQIDPETGLGYGTAARAALKGYEAQLLLTQGHAA
ncbi:Hint domain-containing protein [Litoreibacter ponti]|uniref:Hint domain-containing protein n=1 Tax=Litoreibacter ponti TaxID=1510457 RepID=A0A2T6BPZ1_9RHOB|nr:Hint domain-containing protein [Litoreibacter ponti]PTX58037.1 Hint domain-containing protein [Litoreibacter ponti]